MKNLKNFDSSQNLNLRQSLYNEDFVKIVNSLSDSIKEFYKVSKNINQNEN